MSESLTALFDAVDLVRHPVPGLIERVPLDQLELAPNHRKAIDRKAFTASPRCWRRPGS